MPKKPVSFSRTFISLSLLLLTFLPACAPQDTSDPTHRPEVETIVVALPDDPYYSLAQKIAEEEGLKLTASLTDAIQQSPRYIIQVASPEQITSENLLQTGKLFSEQGYYPGYGIITGSTLAKAEALWQRRSLAHSGRNFTGSDVEETLLQFEPAIFDLSVDPPEQLPLTRETLVSTLAQADFFHWSRHSGGSSWYWNSESGTFTEADEIRAADITPLGPVVVYAPSCSSFRPWLPESIALAFVDQGAAAYAGNVNSPFHTGAILKQGTAVPGPTSWSEFPLGLVVQVENKASARAYFKVPQFFMLGDPRLYLSSDQPYTLFSDEVLSNEQRLITGNADEAGMLAIKIEDGASYDYLSVKDITSVSESDLFHNTRLQTLNLGTDKYILLLQPGGPFIIRLSHRAPLLWSAADTLLDVMDYGWVVMWLDHRVINAPVIYTAALAIFLLILLLKTFKEKKPLRQYARVFLLAGLFVAVRFGYYLLRVDDYTVSANLLAPTVDQMVLGSLGIFACTAGGLVVLQDARTLRAKVSGWVFALLPELILALFYLAFIPFMNTLTAVNGMTFPWQWNFNVLVLASLSLMVEAVMTFVLYRFSRSRNLSGK